jgi:hypothetical protein
MSWHAPANAIAVMGRATGSQRLRRIKSLGIDRGPGVLGQTEAQPVRLRMTLNAAKTRAHVRADYVEKGLSVGKNFPEQDIGGMRWPTNIPTTTWFTIMTTFQLPAELRGLGCSFARPGGGAVTSSLT